MQDNDISTLNEEIRRYIKSSVGYREIEELIIEFLDNMNLTTLQAKQDILAEFYEFALKKHEEKIQELINEEKLINTDNEESNFIIQSIEKVEISPNSIQLNNIFLKLSRMYNDKQEKKRKRKSYN
ncbi:type I restriction endonuclease subunit R [Mycoplasma anatis]|uniref:Type I restriction endonuclease subunit R n=1 Tax=Mycoplasmopsis anatis TaxID=171279 RepID=A0A9Q3L809_9BACT|nr:hypothetical protein [Mycoplasmopsis anatis]MBW0595787.1 type I restriction endonuclease subunit R [Mycoplasmopsis anatis]MBW0596970.1 type I restriction endonuclease subunit R [Mycoplasmopsis anatis]MBW0597731.1 type I restriction endonuclease subunit R [Mycoplasmopsis anatis]MBW0599497.1 type I restriction endonuclease subunit R [Mycoplasmopsis anatis]MBW0600330.1 type I restriction endonuclease subunit R [Mycoplasmopsis anatis]